MLIMLNFGLSLIFCSFLVVNGQVRTTGRCPNVRTQRNFDVQRYRGVWFEYSRFPTTFQEGVTCSRATYTPFPDGTVDVLNQGFRRRENRLTAIEGIARPANPGNPRDAGRLVVDFPSTPGPPGNYWVLDTDYGSYSVVYSCTDGMGQGTKAEIVYILTRYPGNLSRWLQRVLYYRLLRTGIDAFQLRRTDQFVCPRSLGRP